MSSSARAALEEVRARLDADLDAPGALSVIDEAAVHAHDAREAASLLGVVL
jgi:hypothetical protein